MPNFAFRMPAFSEVASNVSSKITLGHTSPTRPQQTLAPSRRVVEGARVTLRPLPQHLEVLSSYDIHEIYDYFVS